MPRPPTSAKPSSQPAWPPSAEFSRRSGPALPPNMLPPPTPPGPPAWPSTRPRPLYSKISDSDAVVARARDPRPVGRGREFDERGHAPPTSTIAAPPDEQLAQRVQRAAPGAARATARRRRCRARPPARRPSSSRSRARRTRPQDEPARARRPSSARTAHHSAATQHSTSSASGLLWREIATVIGVSREREPRRRSRRRARSAGARGRRRAPRSRSPSAPAARGC